ncbi:MAG: S8 family serine peptidase [Spirochaetales bacterium]|nr:S8 family serine peptidase [Spirochaetales bacterium]
MYKMKRVFHNLKKNHKKGFISFSPKGFFILTIVCFCMILGSSPVIYSQSEEGYGFSEGNNEGTPYVPNELIVKFKSESAQKVKTHLDRKKDIGKLQINPSLDALHKRNHLKEAKALGAGLERNRRIMNSIKNKVKNNDMLSGHEKRLLRRLNRKKKNLPEPDMSGLYTIRLDLEPGESILDVLEEYRKNPAVEYAELNYLISCEAIPIDPLFKDENNNYQWSLHNDEGLPYPESGRYNPPPGTPDSDIDCTEAWDITTGSEDVIVAVLDTGIDYNHRDLQGNLWINTTEQNGLPDFDDDHNGYIDDIYGYDFGNNRSDNMDVPGMPNSGHGTHCAGIIGARGNNAYDITGVCWNVKIMGLKLMEGNKSSVSAAIEGICYAVLNGADILSNSWGLEVDVELVALQNTINYAASQGVICFAAAGNNANSIPQYPAAFNNVVAVAALDSNGEKVSFSSFGEWVDIAAPGTDILSLRAAGTSMGTVNDEYTMLLSGTSMACPTAAGVCALILSVNPTLDVDQLTTILKTTGDPIADGICESDKKINAYAAVTNAITSKGYVRFDRDVYTAPDSITLFIGDADLAGDPSVTLFLRMVTESSGYDCGYFTMYPIPGYPGLFSNSVPTSMYLGQWFDDTLYVADNGVLEAYYYDLDNGSGQAGYVIDTAAADCIAPTIVVTPPAGNPVCGSLVVHVETTENSRITINYGRNPNLIQSYSQSKFGTSVDIEINSVVPGSFYYFEVRAEDSAGNLAIDNNQGLMYTFSTTPYDPVLEVPAEYGTIQQAIDAAWNGASVVVSPGIYTETISYNGKSITVKSTDPDNPQVVAGTIIGSPGINTHVVYCGYFETKESLLSGFTINTTQSAGIYISSASPTIQKCRIVDIDGMGQDLKSGIHIISGAPIIEDVDIENYMYGMTIALSASPLIRNSTITNCGYGITTFDVNNMILENTIIHHNSIAALVIMNSVDITIRNNLIYDNEAGINIVNSKRITMTGNTIAHNLNKGISLSGISTTDITVHSSIIWGHLIEIEYLDSAAPIDLTYSCVGGVQNNGTGVIHVSPDFVDAANDNYHINNSSPCRDAGKPGYQALASEVDMDSQPRIMGNTIDMGVDEL